MTFLKRVLPALAVLLLLAPQPGAAQALPTRPATAAPAPRYAQPDDPWIYRGTDIPVDDEWLFGEMPNGLRYAVRRNGVPPGQVAIRVLIDAGSRIIPESSRMLSSSTGPCPLGKSIL